MLMIVLLMIVRLSVIIVEYMLGFVDILVACECVRVLFFVGGSFHLYGRVVEVELPSAHVGDAG